MLLKSGEALTTKEKVIHEQGLVSVLKELHDELDIAVLEAYGWSELTPLMQVVNGNTPLGTNGAPGTRDECKRALDDALLERLVALNAARAAEEKEGLIRWLRPEFQNSDKKAAAPIQAEIEIADGTETRITAKTGKLPWPKALPDQVRQVAGVLAAAREPMSLDARRAFHRQRPVEAAPATDRRNPGNPRPRPAGGKQPGWRGLKGVVASSML